MLARPNISINAPGGIQSDAARDLGLGAAASTGGPGDDLTSQLDELLKLRRKDPGQTAGGNAISPAVLTLLGGA